MSDIFFEQMIRIKTTAITYAEMLFLVIAAVLLSIILFTYSLAYPILIFVIVGIIYGTIYLLKRFFKEYEYILTNGTFDVDCILAKSSRKRILSFNCEDILRVEKYNPAVKINADEKYVCCNLKDNDVYMFLIGRGAKKISLVISPNEKMMNGIKDCLPQSKVRELF